MTISGVRSRNKTTRLPWQAQKKRVLGEQGGGGKNFDDVDSFLGISRAGPTQVPTETP